MNKVEVIKCNDDINKMYDALKTQSDRDYLFFKLAIHSGMKITELLTITVKDTKRLIEKGTLSELCKAHYHSLIKIELPETLYLMSYFTILKTKVCQMKELCLISIIEN